MKSRDRHILRSGFATGRTIASVLLWAAGCAALLAGALDRSAHADRPLAADQTPKEFAGVGITEHLDEPVPLDLAFVDEKGKPVTIGDYFDGEQPVILTLNYYRCPQLCTLELNGLVNALHQIKWSAGSEFQIVTVSIAPEETPELADVKKRAYLTQYRRESAADGWHFLTGSQASITALAEAVGYGYRRDERTGEFAHSACLMFVTPDGRLSRYINNIEFDPADLRLALVEASDGSIGSPMDKFLLFTCYRFDPEAGSFAPSAIKIMRLAGAMTFLVIVFGVFVLWLRGPKSGPTGGPGGVGRGGVGTGDSAKIELGGLQS